MLGDLILVTGSFGVIAFIFLWFIPSFVIARAGEKHVCGYWKALFCTLLFSPVFGWLYVLSSDKLEDVRLRKKLILMADTVIEMGSSEQLADEAIHRADLRRKLDLMARMAITRDAAELLADGVITKNEYHAILIEATQNKYKNPPL